VAVESGNVRVAQAIAVDLPHADRIAAHEFAHVERNPSLALAKGDFRWKQQSGRDLALYALERAARTDAAGARAAWVRQRSNLPVADRLYGNARIAYHASRQLNPLAVEWFREAEGARCPMRSARGGSARRFVPARGPTCSRRSRSCPRPKRRSLHGATGRRAR
jgi:soluble lytic murein transglycosylase